jgi:3,4-dihydroxyphenylacetate 2,3-dioxygenase
MGEIVGAALVSHVPPIVMSIDVRRELNDGLDFTLVDGLHRLRAECLDRVRPDTIVVFDTHWFTTFEHVVSGHDRRSGIYTSDELPRGMAQMPYDFPGDPELADTLAVLADERDDTWIHATRDPYIAVHYPTINLLPFLQRDERWMSVGVCQTATLDDFLLFGSLLGEAVREIDRRVVLLASGGLSHRFWPLRELRDHEAAGLEHIRSAEARSSDEQLIARLEAGDHGAVLAGYDELRRLSPEGFFAHYLMMVGAIGGAACTAQGTKYSEYESAAGTGQVHLWFERPEEGWTA